MTIKQFTKKIIKATNYKGEYYKMEFAIGIMFAGNHIGVLVKNKIVFNEKDIKPTIKGIHHYIGDK